MASENGLFAKTVTEIKKQIDQAVITALEKLGKQQITDQDLIVAQTSIYQASQLFDEAWNKRGILWRLRFEWGLVHHLMNVLSVCAAVWLLAEYGELVQDGIPLWVCYAGVAGAALRSIYWPVYQANRRLLRRVWVAASLTGAFIGMLLASAVYIASKTGLLILSEGKTAPSPHAVGLICMFAGYNWQWALGKFESVVESVTKKPTPKSK